MLAMPLVSYPTTLLWVDDDEIFLQAVEQGFKNHFDIKMLSSAEECLHFFEKYQSNSTAFPLLRGNKDHEEYDLNDHLPVDINLNAIFDLQNHFERSQDIAVMIVDYNMSGKTGIELCRELRGQPIKKILLTGEVNHSLAVDAFNEGVIDCFIRKDEMNLFENLLKHIKKLNAQYFTDITKHLLAHLQADYKLPHSDLAFINFFNKWSRENEIFEFYIVDKNGTFLTKNKSGSIKYFITHTDRSLNVFTDLYAEDKEVNTFIESVRQRYKIPFFGINEEPWNFEFQKWDNFFHPIQILDGRERYYWTVVEESLFIKNLNVA
jgi:CheY-like chemotaxis protein